MNLSHWFFSPKPYLIFSNWILWLSIYHIFNQKSSEIKNYATYATSHYLPLSPKRKEKWLSFAIQITPVLSLFYRLPAPGILGVPGCLYLPHLPPGSRLSPDPFTTLLGALLVQMASSRFHLDFLGSFHLWPQTHPLFPHSPKRVMNV